MSKPQGTFRSLLRPAVENTPNTEGNLPTTLPIQDSALVSPNAPE